MEGGNGISILLRSKDGKDFTVPAAVAWESQMLRHMSDDEDYSHDIIIPIPNVHSVILTKVIEFCTHRVDHASSSSSSEYLSDWEQDFIDAVDLNMLYDLLKAANYLDVRRLLHVMLAKLAEELRGKSVEEIRATLNIANDLTPEEEAAIREEHAWAFA